MECAYGHRTRQVGCVSCVLVFDRAIPGLPIEQPCSSCASLQAELSACREQLDEALQSAQREVARLETEAMERSAANASLQSSLPTDLTRIGEIREQWRVRQYPHIAREAFYEYFEDTSLESWSEVRKEVSNVEAIVADAISERQSELAQTKRDLAVSQETIRILQEPHWCSAEGSATDWSIAPISYQSGATMKSAPSTTPAPPGDGSLCRALLARVEKLLDDFESVPAVGIEHPLLAPSGGVVVVKSRQDVFGLLIHFRADLKAALSSPAAVATPTKQPNPCPKCGAWLWDDPRPCWCCAMRAASLLPAQGQATTQSCRWTSDDEGTWHTACGHAFVFNDGGPAENHFRFCGYCGAPVPG